jgi:hypothetical protein
LIEKKQSMQWQSPEPASSMHRPLIAAHHVRPIPENLHTATVAPSSTSASPQRSGWSSFPGRRSSQPTSGAAAANSSDTFFVRTGGNALQAVSREAAHDEGLLAVTVPIGTKSGHKIMVSVPDGSGRLIEAVVPSGVFEGHTFLVRIPPITPQEQEAAFSMLEDGTRPAAWVPPHAGYMVPYEGGDIPTAQATIAPAPPSSPPPPSTPSPPSDASPTVPGQDVNVQVAQAWQAQPHNPSSAQPLPAARPFSQALNGPRTSTPPAESYNSEDDNGSDLVLVRVPPGTSPGTAIRVRVNDGRIIEATIPEEPGVTEFYVRVPPQSQPQQQNWHDHPLAIAPMALGPFFL